MKLLIKIFIMRLDPLPNAARSEGQFRQGAPIYLNYAIYDTPLKAIYGSHHPKLRSLQSNIDP
jgi:hypothetical protein